MSPKGLARRGRVAIGALVVSVLVASGCTQPGTGEDGEHDDGRAGFEDPLAPTWNPDDDVDPSPAPRFSITVEGASVAPGEALEVSSDEVDVVVPAGVVADEPGLTVSIGEPLGEFGGEVGGRPVEVGHDRPIAEPVVVTWDVGHLTEAQRRALIIVRWDEASEVWLPADLPFRRDDGGHVLTLSTTSWSVLSWSTVVNLGQTLGELAGKRVDAPTCDARRLPDWVVGTTDPDDDTNAAALRVCFEYDDEDSATVRVANNRTFAQFLVLEDESFSWAWTWHGVEDFGAADLSWRVMARQLSNDGRLLIPPLQTVAVGVARPADPGEHFVGVSAEVNALSMLADVVAFGIAQVPSYVANQPFVNAFVTAVLECGGVELLGRPWQNAPNKAADGVVGVVGVVASCVGQLDDDQSNFTLIVQAALRAQMQAAGSDDEVARLVSQNRWLKQASSAFKLLKVGEVAFYLADLFSDAAVGNLQFSLRLRGFPPELGRWTPTCTDLAEDWNRLFRNVGLAEEFTDTSRLWSEFDGWAPAVRRAVAPLAGCDSAHLDSLATFVIDDWADLDPDGAALVADELRRLVELCVGRAMGGGAMGGGAMGGDEVAVVDCAGSGFADPAIFDGSSSSTFLVIDVSGSMNDPSPVGPPITKYRAADQAARDLMSVIEVDAGMGAEHSVALVAFSDDAAVIVAPTVDLGRAADAISSLSPDGGTDIGAGLATGIATASGGADERRIVLLSDGDITSGMSQDQVLGQIVPRAVDAGVAIDVIGFAAPGSLDETFLLEVATRTGGRFSLAETAQELRQSLIRARHEATGTVVVDVVGRLDTGSGSPISQFDVPVGTRQLVVSLGLDDTRSGILPLLYDPLGVPVPPHAMRVVGTNPVTVAVDNPFPGQWSVYGTEPTEPARDDSLRWTPPIDGASAGAVVAQNAQNDGDGDGDGVPFILVVSTRAGATGAIGGRGLSSTSSVSWLATGLVTAVTTVALGGVAAVGHVLLTASAGGAPGAGTRSPGAAPPPPPGLRRRWRRPLTVGLAVGAVTGVWVLTGSLIGTFGA